MNQESNYVDTLKSIKRSSNQKQHSTSRNAEILDETMQLKSDSNHVETPKSMRKPSTRYKSFESSNAEILYRIPQ
jgi:hypothetical protein